MTTNNGPKCPANFVPRSYQLEFLEAMSGTVGVPNSGKRRALLVWSRQMGKDTSCGIFMFIEALQVPGNYFYCFPFKTDARLAFWEKIEDSTGKRFIEQIPAEFIKRRSDQEMSLELINGSIIRAVGFDSDPEQARGFSPNGVVFSEAAQMNPKVFSNMDPAIDMNNAWVIYNSTPFGNNHFYTMYKGALADEDYFVSLVQTYFPEREGYYEAKPRSYFEKAISSGRMLVSDVEREYGCAWDAEVKGSYYSGEIRAAYESGRVGDFKYDPNYPVNTYWDVGDIDDTVVWFAQQIRGRTIFIDYFTCNKPTGTSMAQMLLDKGYRYGWHMLPWDARPTSMGVSQEDLLVDAFHNFGVSGRVDCAPRSGVQVGISAVRTRFPNYYFDIGKCGTGLELLEQYHRKYDNRTQRFLDEPVHNHPSSHCADALRTEAISENHIGDSSWGLNGVVKTTKVFSDFRDDET